jgi:N-acyl-D-amino-acid deacylase
MVARRITLAVCVLAAAPIWPSKTAFAQRVDFDVLIRNGRILDGTGNPYYTADVGIRDDQIVAIGKLSGRTATRTIDAAGLYVTPGFIDLHSHADEALASNNAEARKAHNLISQGITTVVGGADGRNAAWPVAAEKAAFERLGIGQNVVLMVGHSTVRQQVMGTDYEREATPQEVARMRALVRQGMEEGAWGLGAGPEYRPARFSAPSEIVELAREVANYDGFYFSHQRSEAALPMWALASISSGKPIDGTQALEETINIARETGIRVVASHIKTRGRASWGRSHGDVFLINEARERGLQVYADQYPYNTGGGPREMVPAWAFAAPGFDRSGGQDDPRLRDPSFEASNFDAARRADAAARGARHENLVRNLANPETRRLIEQDVEYLVKYWSGPDTHIIMAAPDPALIGKSLSEVARARNENFVQTVIHYTVQAGQAGGRFTMRVSSMNELDVENYMRQEWTATSSDAGIDDAPGQGPPGMHPRLYGAFVRKIAHYVKDRGIITLPFAVRSSSGLPAQIVGLKDRGYLREGYKADVVIFDYQSLQDRATAMQPNLYSEGVKYVLVNGKVSVDNGRLTGVLPGVVIARSAPARPRTQE